ncbi:MULTISPECIES: hypothetical protein [Streptosporangium]|uniref:Aminoglycoside phosphotransferase n=1 Tax=Streptosporangium brasiliense TaxID=47480 RepID=A0ABT9R4V0_9ACTN|nr:hypothetical protein [Streptosporangium brasiliense]MDP9863917.1 hypothetical protein [Streptosporangium brasiliense]
MAVARIHWDDLPNETRAAVEKHTGSVWSSQTVSEGLNSAVAALLDTVSGKVFIKGLHRDYPRRWTQDMEAMINPHVHGLAPRLLWRVEGEWDVLGFEAVDGHHADFGPGSSDLPLLVGTMMALGKLSCPNLPMKVAEHRWRTYVAAPEELKWLRGDRLLHTDYNPVNVLIADGRALLIDWAWPTRGAGWIDPACLILRLMAGGHTAEEAERVVAQTPAWSSAPEEGIEVFARANVRLWDEIAGNDSAPWIKRMTRVAHEWLEYWASTDRLG